MEGNSYWKECYFSEDIFGEKYVSKQRGDKDPANSAGYTEGLELEDAVHIALLTLKETIEGEMNGETVEIGMSSLLWYPLLMLTW